MFAPFVEFMFYMHLITSKPAIQIAQPCKYAQKQSIFFGVFIFKNLITNIRCVIRRFVFMVFSLSSFPPSDYGLSTIWCFVCFMVLTFYAFSNFLSSKSIGIVPMNAEHRNGNSITLKIVPGRWVGWVSLWTKIRELNVPADQQLMAVGSA